MRAFAALSADAAGTPPWQTLGLLVFAAGVYVGWMFLRSRLGGWQRWASRFGTRFKPPDGFTYRWREGFLGEAFGPYFRHGLHIALVGEGLYVCPSLLNRLFHPPLLLPWRCAEVWKKEGWGWSWLVVLCRSDAPPLRIILPTGAEAALTAHRTAARRQCG